MQGKLVDLVLLSFLVLFFGLQQRRRHQLYFRLWFAGWIFVFLSVAVWDIRLLSPRFETFRELCRLDMLFLGGCAFALSFVVKLDRNLRTLLLFGGVVACTFLILDVYSAYPALLPYLLPFIAAAQLLCVAITLALPAHWRRRKVALLVLIFFSSAHILYTSRMPDGMMVDAILSELFLFVAVLYIGTFKIWTIEWAVGATGFVAWGLSYLLYDYLGNIPELRLIVGELWNLPKYAVGFSMTLRIFGEARKEISRLASGYKVLYEDFRLLYEDHPLPMWVYDESSLRFRSVNASAIASYGFSEEEFLRMGVQEITVANEPAGERSQLTSSGRGTLQRIRQRRKDGTILVAELTEHTINFQGSPARFVLAVDVTERERLNQELLFTAQHDSLTGLPNRLLLEDRIVQTLARCGREQAKAALFTIDVDRFKLINDTYGHLVGDECLKAIASRLRGRIRQIDTIARTGGEEFTAVIGGLRHAADAQKIASLFVSLFDEPLKLPGREMKLSISVGGAVYPDDAEDVATLRKKSDQALYYAKRAGRNRFAFASSEVCSSFDRAAAIEVALRGALRNNAFELHFQPIYDSAGCVARFEALIRMKDTHPVLFGPSEFIPIAEESGLILPIGSWALRSACQQLAEWYGLLDGKACLAINVSGRQLVQKGFARFVVETLREFNLPPESIELELTETSLMTEPVLIRECMAELAETGILFAIDDFGTGYSSLARLASLPIDLLKIDQSFVAQIGRAEREDGIVTAIIQMAQTLNVRLVAEGVEDEIQLNALLRKGCDLFQGFYLSEPLTAGQVTDLIRQRSDELFANPRFSQARVPVTRQVHPPAQLPALVVAEGNTGGA